MNSDCQGVVCADVKKSATNNIIFSNLFQPEGDMDTTRSVKIQTSVRQEGQRSGGDRIVLDRFGRAAAVCSFVRLAGAEARRVRFELRGSYELASCLSGGWLLGPTREHGSCYWFPQSPVLRSVADSGHIRAERETQPSTFKLMDDLWISEFEIPPDFYLDVVAWQIPAAEGGIIESLSQLTALEAQTIFLWGSHTTYQQPADVYRHLIFGHVYENRYAWPHKRKICSENDAHALYVALCGLQQATGRTLYALLKEQLLLSVLARQSSDGGWHHGEWTDDMEAHLRLNGSAIHLLLDSLDEREDPYVRQALDRAVRFVARHKDELRAGTWLLHDALELGVESMQKAPFRWARSRALGKSPSNMLVLNTHLDTAVLLDRYREITGDSQYSQLVESAHSATRAALRLRTAEGLYRLLFKWIDITLLPAQAAKRLPLHVRALKRVAWKYLIPSLHWIKSCFPRLVMPGGYIDRALSQRGLADPYHSINVMDLARYQRRFPVEELDGVVQGALDFVQKGEIRGYWAEQQRKKYALGFWAEALYHLYALKPSDRYRRWLGEIMLKLEDGGLGMPPSLLGANAEAVPVKMQIPSLSLADVRLRVANLSRGDVAEFLIVNPTYEALPLVWERADPCAVVWEHDGGLPLESADSIKVPARGWLYGRQKMATKDKAPCVSGL
jgi:hypothetical protein